MSYILVIARNIVLNQWRHRNTVFKVRKSFTSGKVLEQNPLKNLTDQEQYNLIQSAVSDLDPKLRETFCTVIYGDIGYKEAAEILGVSVYTVQWRMGQAMEKLRKELRTYFEERI
jgi:RNA polymerase sigma-70 factor (ECF subfamily)